MQKRRAEDWKYTININLEKDYRYFAQLAYKLLHEHGCPGISLNACGFAVLSQLKVSGLLSEYLPGLHKSTTIMLKSCASCHSKELKGLFKDRGTEEERMQAYVKRASPFEDKWPNSNQFSHKCQVHTTFPKLIIFQQRLSLKELDEGAFKESGEVFTFKDKPATHESIYEGVPFDVFLKSSNYDDDSGPTSTIPQKVSSAVEEVFVPNPEAKHPNPRKSFTKVNDRPCHWHECRGMPGSCGPQCVRKKSYDYHADFCGYGKPQMDLESYI